MQQVLSWSFLTAALSAWWRCHVVPIMKIWLWWVTSFAAKFSVSSHLAVISMKTEVKSLLFLYGTHILTVPTHLLGQEHLGPCKQLPQFSHGRKSVAFLYPICWLLNQEMQWGKEWKKAAVEIQAKLSGVSRVKPFGFIMLPPNLLLELACKALPGACRSPRGLLKGLLVFT